MISIRYASEADIPSIHQLAIDIWWPTYREVLSSEQISFMLEKMYSEDALLDQLTLQGIDFIIVEEDGKAVGFAGYSMTDPGKSLFKIHKLYLLPSQQGKGTGRALIEFITDVVCSKGGAILELNVNRGNPALGFYEKMGFSIYETVDIPYHGFVLNDYIMRKKL